MSGWDEIKESHDGKRYCQVKNVLTYLFLFIST